MLTIVALLCGLATAQAAEQSVKLAGMDVSVWSQQVDTGIKQPVIIFSHGFHGCATQSRFLMEAFASAGYIIFAPNHRDATCHGGEAKWNRQTPNAVPEAAEMERNELPTTAWRMSDVLSRPFGRMIGFVNELIGAARLCGLVRLRVQRQRGEAGLVVSQLGLDRSSLAIQFPPLGVDHRPLGLQESPPCDTR